MRDKSTAVTLSDEAILALFFEREERAILATEKKYGAYLLTVAQRILGNLQDSEECLNDTYLKAWNSIPPTRPRILRAFLARITRNAALDRYDEARRQKRVPPELCDSLSELEGVLAPTAPIEREEEARRIGRVISDFLSEASDRRLYIFLGRYFYAMPIREIVERTGCSESTVHRTLASMKEELRAILKKEGISI